MICTKIDGWLEDVYLSKARWEVVLSNGLTVYQDDDRPGLKPASAWERLYDYCRENDVYVQSMIIRFRSHVEPIGSNADGFFFSKCVTAGFSSSMDSFLTGTLVNGILTVSKWSIPALTKSLFIDDSKEQVRNPDECGIHLIRKNNVKEV